MPSTDPKPTESVRPESGLEGLQHDEFAQLEAKVERVAEALQAARGERDRALAELEPLRDTHARLQQAHAGLERELVALRKERNEIRQRVNRLVSQLESSLG